MGSFIDLTGKKFGSLTALEYVENTKWKCQCSCGKITIVEGGHLRSGHTSSCGCKLKAMKSSDGGLSSSPIVGKRFAKLIVEEYLGEGDYLCLCDCGASRIVKGKYLRNGDTKSCGCLKYRSVLRAEYVGKKFGRLLVLSRNGKRNLDCICDCGREVTVQCCNVVTGSTTSCGCYKIESGKKPKKHGKSQSKAYRTWGHMIQRCTNPKNSSFRDYGAKGITVCKSWVLFENFFSDMGEQPSGHSLDRIDPFKGYDKDNCRWVTSNIQGDNKTNTKYIIYGNRRLTVSGWAKELGINRDTLYNRLYVYKWPVEKAFSKSPTRKSNGVVTHQMSKSKAYRAWSGAKSRCTNPNNKAYNNYGARGVQMCPKWCDSFEAFLEEMGHPPSASHSLDRIDPTGNYCKENCRWATAKTQGNNKRGTVYFEYEGRKWSLAELSELSVVPANILRWRLRNGWETKDALRTPSGSLHRYSRTS